MIIHNITTNQKITQKTTLIYIGDDYLSWEEINDKIVDWTQESNLLMSNIFFVGSDNIIKTLCEESAKGNYALDKISIHRKLQYFAYKKNGSFYEFELLNGNIIKTEQQLFFNNILSQLGKEIVHNLIVKSDLVTPAPHGFYFKKQSGRLATHFIRGGNLLISSSSIDFVSACIQKRFDTFCKSSNGPRIRILIDTMAIWPVAQSIALRRKAIDNSKRIYIESIRSYEGLNSEFQISDEPSFVIISASTSDGFRKELDKRINKNKTRYTTILRLALDRNSTESLENSREFHLFSIPATLPDGLGSLNGSRKIFKSDIPSSENIENCLEMVSENFISKSAQPAKVKLLHNTVSPAEKLLLATIANEKLTVAGLPNVKKDTYWPISFNIDKLIKFSKAKLYNWIKNYASAGNCLIIHDNGDGSLKVGELIEKQFLSLSPHATTKLVSYTDTHDPDSELKKFAEHSSVIVCSALLGNGFIFKLVSANLRHIQPHGPRLYLCLAALPETRSHLKDLESDITSNADNSSYKLRVGFSLEVGKIDIAVNYKRENQFLLELKSQYKSEGIKFPSFLENRLDYFRGIKPLRSNSIFLLNDNTNKLYLSSGFLLWDQSYSGSIHGDDLGPDVLLTISTFLQKSRSLDNPKNQLNNLATNLYQQRLISPGMFTRFNDPLIQASILRCAYDSELNYSSSKEMSHEMCSIILNLVDFYKVRIGSALAEFLYALRVKRLQLDPEDYDKVKLRVQTLPCWLSRILN